jgi:hypothetical protein
LNRLTFTLGQLFQLLGVLLLLLQHLLVHLVGSFAASAGK